MSKKMIPERAVSLAAAATKGPWMVYDSCSYRRIGTDGPHKEVIYAVQYRDGVCGLEGKRADMELAASAPDLAALVVRLAHMLARYRDETPLGHQPHMIAHEVDEALGR